MAGSGTAHLRADRDVLLRVEGLVVEYKTRRGEKLQAVSDVSFDVARGETLGLVGESGCGKSTTAKTVLRLQRPTNGTITFDGQDVTALSSRALRSVRRRLQLVFQDPISSLNPGRKVKDIVAEGLSINGVPRPWEPAVNQALRAVGLDPAAISDRRPSELSGGQCQRIAIARALVLEPLLIVCDEPVSSLDVSVQAQILNLLEEMKARYELTLLFISHDLAVVKNVSDRVAVMFRGKLCEIAGSDDLYQAPQHPYTQALLNSVPVPDPFIPLPPLPTRAEVTSPLDVSGGCRFRQRCPRAEARCAEEEPIIRPAHGDHYVACHFPGPADPSAATTGATRVDRSGSPAVTSLT